MSKHLATVLTKYALYLLSDDKNTLESYLNTKELEKDRGGYKNIYTNYSLLTEEGKNNILEKEKCIINCVKTLRDALSKNEESISLNDFWDIVSFCDEERTILKKQTIQDEMQKEAIQELEKASTPIKPNSMTYTTNKIHQNLSKVETLTEISEDILPISLSKKKGDIVAIVSMETMQDAIYKLNLTPFDELILDASKNLFKYNKEINTESVCDYITGNTGTRPNKTILEDIEKSLLTISGKILRLDYGTQKHLKGKHNGEEIEIHFTAPLLPIKAVKVKYKGYEKTFYRLIGTYEENEYFKFSDALGQLTSTKTLYLKTGDKVRINKENTLINNYLARQITLIKRGSLDTNKISYDKIYALCGIDETDEKDSNALIQRKNRIRANVSYLLKEKEKLGFIKHFEEYKETQGTAHRVAGVEIFTEDDTKKK